MRNPEQLLIAHEELQQRRASEQKKKRLDREAAGKVGKFIADQIRARREAAAAARRRG